MHLLVTLNGVIVDFELAGANEADLTIGLEVLEGHQHLTVVADKAYISQSAQLRLKKEQQLKLLTNKRRNQRVAAQPERSN